MTLDWRSSCLSLVISGITGACITSSSNTLILDGVAVIRVADFYKPAFKLLSAY